jgi:hypothetical protein
MVMVNIEADPKRQHPRAVTEELVEERLDLHGVRVLASTMKPTRAISSSVF